MQLICPYFLNYFSYRKRFLERKNNSIVGTDERLVSGKLTFPLVLQN